MPTVSVDNLNQAKEWAEEAAKATEGQVDYLARIERFFLAFAECSDHCEEGEYTAQIPLAKWHDALARFRAVV